MKVCQNQLYKKVEKEKIFILFQRANAVNNRFENINLIKRFSRVKGGILFCWYCQRVYV